MRLGIQFQPPLGVKELVEVARRADGLGYDSFWLTDTAVGSDPFAVLATIAGATDRIRLATGVASIFHRHPVTLAGVARTVDDLSDGRMILGLGTSHREMMERLLGVPWRKPLTAMKEAVTIIHDLLDGKRVDFDGTQYRVHAKLDPAPRRRVPVFIGAIQSKMLQYAGSAAEGVMLNHLIPSYAPTVIEEIRRGATGAGRRPEDVEIVVSVPTYVAQSPEEARQARATRKEMLGFYVGLNIYRRRYTNMGFGAEMDAIAGAIERGEPVAPLVPDAMVDQMVNAGSAEECRDVIDRYRAAGADAVLIVPIFPPGDLSPFFRTIEALAPARIAG
ncbi:MAG TPA: LLM class flavin-dependent oxidoreductase [Dehalococcoidia bacterium]|nr:LLM class flavin-dependent oxidoreductase [Dehalococcoidia bacterium]